VPKSKNIVKMFRCILFWLTISSLGVFSVDFKIHSNEMVPEMKDYAIAIAIEATRISTDLSDVSHKLVEEFNKKYGKNWECIVSKEEIGLDVSHEPGTLISFTILSSNLMLFMPIQSQFEKTVDSVLSCTSSENCSMVK
jgi:hypothetical protein